MGVEGRPDYKEAAREHFGGDRAVLYLDCGGTQLYAFVTTHDWRKREANWTLKINIKNIKKYFKTQVQML